MASWQANAFSRFIRLVVRRRDWGDERALTRRARRLFGAPSAYARFSVVGLERRAVHAGAVHGEWLIPRDAKPGTVFYVHGGGFVSCSPRTHRPIAAALARLTRRPVFSVDYRLAPEHRLPAACDDVLAAHAWLLETGVLPRTIAVVGDSAGGNLVFSLGVNLRDAERPLPACIVAFSPWTDLTGHGASVRTNDGRCAMFRTDNIRDFASAATGVPEAERDDPAISPAYADLRGLPPVQVHVGSTELLLDDARTVHQRIVKTGGTSDLRVFDDVPHGWQMLTPWMPEARHSLREAASFIDARLR